MKDSTTISKQKLLIETEGINAAKKTESLVGNLKYAIIGAFFGIVFVKAEIISWFRIQEMFRFQAFHMYGVIGTAVVVAAISVFLIKRFNIKTIDGETVQFAEKPMHKGVIIGGLMFGCGWALTGACPGPLYAQIGAGFPVVIITLLSAIAGAWFYGYFQDKLPH
jgi:uncharacterized protein